MKIPQKLQPYQRSRHRAALQAWVVAATAVASVGMPAKALSQRDDEQAAAVHQRDHSASVQAAQHVAGAWLDAVRSRDRAEVLASMRLPREAEHERAVLDEVAALSDWLSHSDAEIEHVASRQAGHWALSAWRLDGADGPRDDTGLIEPITLYNPAADGLSDSTLRWEVVPQGFAQDPALGPLYNDDHDALMHWYESLT